MSLSSLSIRRPVLAIVMSIAIVVLGLLGYTYLGVREYPSVDPPTITVSTAYTGSTITVEFDIDVNLETAANDVRDKVSRAVRNLPPDVEPPIVSKADADASPIVFLNIQSDTRKAEYFGELYPPMFTWHA